MLTAHQSEFMYVHPAYVPARSRELNLLKRESTGSLFLCPVPWQTSLTFTYIPYSHIRRSQHLQNKIYAIINATISTTKFQKPVKIKSTIMPILNQKKAKPHTRFIFPPCDHEPAIKQYIPVLPFM